MTRHVHDQSIDHVNLMAQRGCEACLSARGSWKALKVLVVL